MTCNRHSTLRRSSYVVANNLSHHRPHQADPEAMSFDNVVLIEKFVSFGRKQSSIVEPGVVYERSARCPYTLCGSLRLSTNRCKAPKNLSVVISVHNAKWTARMVEHVKRAI